MKARRLKTATRALALATSLALLGALGAAHAQDQPAPDQPPETPPFENEAELRNMCIKSVDLIIKGAGSEAAELEERKKEMVEQCIPGMADTRKGMDPKIWSSYRDCALLAQRSEETTECMMEAIKNAGGQLP